MEELPTISTTEVLLVKYRFYSTVIADILKAIQGGSLGGAFVLSFCCIDYMGLAMQLNSDKNTNNDYKSYIRKYLTRINHKYTDFENHLYALRCSLIHTYGESEATKKLNIIPQYYYYLPPAFSFHDHLRYEPKTHKFHLNLSDFVSEVITSVELFFKENNNNNELKSWGAKLYYPQGLREILRKVSGENGTFKHGDIHSFLSMFETESDLAKSSAELKLRIESEIKDKHLDSL